MAEGKNIIQIYRDWFDITDELSVEQTAMFWNHFGKYVRDQNPDESELEPIILGVWLVIKAQLKRDLRKWEDRCLTNSSNGKLGGRPRKSEKSERLLKKQTVSEKAKKAKKADKDKDKDKDMYIEDITIQNISDHIKDRILKTHNCKIKDESSYDISEKWLDHWKSQGWVKANGQKIQNWKSTLNNNMAEGTGWDWILKAIEQGLIKERPQYAD